MTAVTRLSCDFVISSCRSASVASLVGLCVIDGGFVLSFFHVFDLFLSHQQNLCRLSRLPVMCTSRVVQKNMTFDRC